MKCGECKLDFPDEILAPFITSKGTTAPVCGICALKRSNEFHGDNRSRFDGQKAEYNRQEALRINRERGKV